MKRKEFKLLIENWNSLINEGFDDDYMSGNLDDNFDDPNYLSKMRDETEGVATSSTRDKLGKELESLFGRLTEDFPSSSLPSVNELKEKLSYQDGDDMSTKYYVEMVIHDLKLILNSYYDNFNEIRDIEMAGSGAGLPGPYPSFSPERFPLIESLHQINNLRAFKSTILNQTKKLGKMDHPKLVQAIDEHRKAYRETLSLDSDATIMIIDLSKYLQIVLEHVRNL